MFDDMFDFDGDGKVDAGEEFCAMMMFEECMREDEDNKSRSSYHVPAHKTSGRSISGWEVLGVILIVLYVIGKLSG